MSATMSSSKCGDVLTTLAYYKRRLKETSGGRTCGPRSQETFPNFVNKHSGAWIATVAMGNFTFRS